MSAKLLGMVWELDLPSHERDVLLVLADHAKPDGSDCFPSVARVAWMVGKNERSVQRAMRELEEKKILVYVSGREGGRLANGKWVTANYTIDLSQAPKKPPYQRKGDTHATPPVQGKGDTFDVLGVTPTPPELKTEPTTTKAPPPLELEIEAPPAADLFEEVWKTHRRGSKAEARVAYKKAITSGVSPEVLLRCLRVYVERELRDDFTGAHLVNWIKQERWEEYIDAKPKERRKRTLGPHGEIYG